MIIKPKLLQITIQNYIIFGHPHVTLTIKISVVIIFLKFLIVILYYNNVLFQYQYSEFCCICQVFIGSL